MNNPDPWKPFFDVINNPWEYASRIKLDGERKLIAHLLPDVPEEIIHASGALPVAIEGAGRQVGRAQAVIPGYTCSHALGYLEMGLDGTFSGVDGFIVPYVCDTTRNLFHIWNSRFPEKENEFLRLPKNLTSSYAREYALAEFERLQLTVCSWTGINPDKQKLTESIKLYNQSKSLLRRAYAEHRKNPEVWTINRLRLLTVSAMKSLREDHVTWMGDLPWNEDSIEHNSERIPIYVRGKIWDPPGLTELLHQLGFHLAGDEVTTGYRSCCTDVDESIDPLMALVDKFFRVPAYTGYHMDPKLLVSSFLERVNSSEAIAVILLNPKFCEAAGFDTPDLQKALEENGIHVLVLETSAKGVGLDQIRLRLEAFREMIGGDLLYD